MSEQTKELKAWRRMFPNHRYNQSSGSIVTLKESKEYSTPTITAGMIVAGFGHMSKKHYVGTVVELFPQHGTIELEIDDSPSNVFISLDSARIVKS